MDRVNFGEDADELSGHQEDVENGEEGGGYYDGGSDDSETGGRDDQPLNLQQMSCEGEVKMGGGGGAVVNAPEEERHCKDEE